MTPVDNGLKSLHRELGSHAGLSTHWNFSVRQPPGCTSHMPGLCFKNFGHGGEFRELVLLAGFAFFSYPE